MSENSMAHLISASNTLTSTIQSKMGEIEQSCLVAEQKLASYLKQATEQDRQRMPLPPNIFNNSLLRSLESDQSPTGYTSVGCTLTGVHPYTQGFEGVYSQKAPEKAATSPANADAEHPCFYGAYHMGNRFIWGGLQKGWSAVGDGHVLKVTSEIKDESVYFNLPTNVNGRFGKALLRFWIRIVQGELFVGRDAGWWASSRSRQWRAEFQVNAEMTQQAKDGWLFVEQEFDLSGHASMNVNRNSFNFGLNNQMENEIYIALPYMCFFMDGAAMISAQGETYNS